MINLIGGFIVGVIIGIFIYRNNTKLLDPYAKKVDQLWDERVEKN